MGGAHGHDASNRVCVDGMPVLKSSGQHQAVEPAHVRLWPLAHPCGKRREDAVLGEGGTYVHFGELRWKAALRTDHPRLISDRDRQLERPVPGVGLEVERNHPAYQPDHLRTTAGVPGILPPVWTPRAPGSTFNQSAQFRSFGSERLVTPRAELTPRLSQALTPR